MSQPDLFTEARRRRLREAGWHEAAGIFHGVPMWRSPDGAEILTEEEAVRRLQSEEDRNQ